jgi:arginine/lysine/ornithine decarboxylase
VGCPPAIPIVICGEEIDKKAISAFKYYGIEKCLVVGE